MAKRNKPRDGELGVMETAEAEGAEALDVTEPALVQVGNLGMTPLHAVLANGEAERLGPKGTVTIPADQVSQSMRDLVDAGVFVIHTL